MKNKQSLAGFSGKITILVLSLIIVLAGFLRFYKLTENPPSLSWDETAVGYNAWSIFNLGKDEWGKSLPLVFKSFEDDKHPVHIYLTVPTVAIFGLNEMGVRSSTAIFGILNVLIIFFLARKLFKSDLAGIIASLVLAISPYSIHFSRFNHELNFVLFFFMSGIYFLLKGISKLNSNEKEKKNYLIILGFVLLGIDLLTYHSAKVMVPVVTLLIITLYFRDLWKLKKLFLLGIMSFSLFISLLFIEPALLGTARLKQTSSEEQRNFEALKTKYLSHFTYSYLFERGDANPRLSAQSGTFYKADALFLIIGALALIWGIVKGRKEFIIIAVWILLAPIPSAITSEAPHAARAGFMTGSWHLLVVLGIYTLISLFKNKYLKIGVGGVVVVIYTFLLVGFWKGYFNDYMNRYAIEWQYGMKQIVEFVNTHPEYDEVYMTAERQQPYIFFLYGTKTSVGSYLKSVRYNNTQSRPANTVASYSRYHFGLWDQIESLPIPHILYVVTPATYTGLRHRLSFDTVGEIKYPNGTSAFYLVAAKIYE